MAAPVARAAPEELREVSAPVVLVAAVVLRAARAIFGRAVSSVITTRLFYYFRTPQVTSPAAPAPEAPAARVVMALLVPMGIAVVVQMVVLEDRRRRLVREA